MNIGIIVAAGKSQRMQGRANKLLMLLEDKPVLEHTLDVFNNCKAIDSIILVANEEIKEQINIKKFKKIKKIVLGGRERQDSVYNGIKAIEKAEDDDIAVIHNGANPLVNGETIVNTINEAKKHGASCAAFRVNDTVRQVNDGFGIKVLDRNKIWLMQTPQCIKYGIAKEAFEKAKKEDYYGTDDAMLVERLGKKVKIVESNSENIKITKQFDLNLAENLRKNFIVGLGQDSHRFTDENKKLVLGGAVIPNEKGLKANSDGDVILHALFNAISQALGKKSLGYYADPLCNKGITDSREYIRLVLEMMGREKYKINNVGIMLECKTPAIDKHSDRIKIGLAKLLNIKKEQIGITATSGEGLTAFGKGKGIQCFTIVSLKK